MKKEKWLIIIGNILLFFTCILQVIVELNSAVYIALIGISVLLELIGIALGKEEWKWHILFWNKKIARCKIYSKKEIVK